VGLGWSIVVLGTAARVRLYAANRSLWTDEACLAVNLASRSFSGLCRPLDHNQGAPLLFLWAERFAVQMLGGRESALRLIPLLSGIATLVLFLQFARRHLTTAAGLIALATLAFAKDLLRYSAEVKQYSTDATVALVLLWLAARVLNATDGDRHELQREGRAFRGHRARALIAFTGVSALAVWLSHPAVFVVAASGAALFLVAFPAATALPHHRPGADVSSRSPSQPPSPLLVAWLNISCSPVASSPMPTSSGSGPMACCPFQPRPRPSAGSRGHCPPRRAIPLA
jgi:hypothetical protein